MLYNPCRDRMTVILLFLRQPHNPLSESIIDIFVLLELTCTWQGARVMGYLTDRLLHNHFDLWEILRSNQWAQPLKDVSGCRIF